MWREALSCCWEGLRRISERDAGRLKSTDGGATELTFLLRFELAVLPSPFLSLTLTTAFPQNVEHGRKHQFPVIPLFLLVSKLLLPRPQQPTLPSLLLHRPPSTSSLLSDACLSLSSPHFLALPKQSGIITSSILSHPQLKRPRSPHASRQKLRGETAQKIALVDHI